jgi:alpha-N-arabinofuranosidase
LGCDQLTSGLYTEFNSSPAGINVNSSWIYNASFYYKFPGASSFSGNLNVMLQSSSGTLYASASVPISGSTTTWTQVVVTLTPTSSSTSTTNNFAVTVDGAIASGETIHFAMFSLFPPTFKGRANGLRMDLAQVCFYFECEQHVLTAARRRYMT